MAVKLWKLVFYIVESYNLLVKHLKNSRVATPSWSFGVDLLLGVLEPS